MSTTHNVPQGDLVLRTLAMPADTNANGDIFGGWLMSQMDIGGAILAKEIAHGRVVTVRHPQQGDVAGRDADASTPFPAAAALQRLPG